MGMNSAVKSSALQFTIYDLRFMRNRHMETKVKICGITNVADGLAAAEAGADMIGLMFYDKSPRNISLVTGAEISRALPPFVLRVGVFANPDENLVARAIRECNLNLLQFHGDETSEFCTQFGLMSVKALRVRDAASIEALANFQTDAFLLDAHSKSGLGGTGEIFNWDLAIAAQKFGKPIFLAGGLTPENVAEAVRKVRPFAVDVSSGVESAPGKKDHTKVKAFIAAAKAAKKTNDA
jgi:phosphoribosylanthranilate isomerase